MLFGRAINEKVPAVARKAIAQTRRAIPRPLDDGATYDGRPFGNKRMTPVEIAIPTAQVHGEEG